MLDGGAALLAVCGGYQLLGRGYRGLHGEDMPGVGLLPLETVAGERRMIGDVLLECELDPGVRRPLAGFENHAGRTRLDPGAQPLGRVISGFGNDGESGFEGCRARTRSRHLSPRAAAAAQPVARGLAARRRHWRTEAAASRLSSSTWRTISSRRAYEVSAGRAPSARRSSLDRGPP